MWIMPWNIQRKYNMLVFKCFLRDIYDEVKFINNKFGKGVIINMKKKKTFSQKSANNLMKEMP